MTVVMAVYSRSSSSARAALRGMAAEGTVTLSSVKSAEEADRHKKALR